MKYLFDWTSITQLLVKVPEAIKGEERDDDCDGQSAPKDVHSSLLIIWRETFLRGIVSPSKHEQNVNDDDKNESNKVVKEKCETSTNRFLADPHGNEWKKTNSIAERCVPELCILERKKQVADEIDSIDHS